MEYQLSQRAGELAPSQIREVAEEGMLLDGVIPLWFGESAWPSPSISVEAAIAALEAGDHFYQPNSGKLILRDGISEYLAKLIGKTIERNRITVTASGMQGIALTAQALITPGDKVVTLVPGWPNVSEAFRLSGADVHMQELTATDGTWQLDMNRLLESLSPGTRCVIVNSPSNPTGWTMSESDQQRLLDHCRKQGTWIVSDDVYARLYRHADCAPSFLAIAEPDDRVISVNSFSKAWSMTGWRLGWITAPRELESTFAMLTEFNIAGPPGFIQAAGLAALHAGEAEIVQLRNRLRTSYTLVADGLLAMPRVQFLEPNGAFYCFFKVAGMSDSLATAKQLLYQSRVGLAPGIAFGMSGEGYLRLCYAQPAEVITQALERLKSGIATAIR